MSERQAVDAPRASPGYRLVRERAMVERRWVVAATGAAVAFMLALGGATAFWVSTRNDLEATEASLRDVRDARANVASDLEDAEEQIDSLEGDVNGARLALNAAEITIGKAQACIRRLFSAGRAGNFRQVATALLECRAVLRDAPGGGLTFSAAD